MVVSCGGETTSGTNDCAPVEPCGGDLVGTWKVVSSCVHGTAQETTSACSLPLTTQIQSVTYSGTVTFDPDLHYVTTVTASGRMALTYPAACLTSARLTCEELSQSLVQMPTSSGGVKGTGCYSSGGGDCQCTFDVQTPAHETPGAYSTNGNSVTITTNGRSVSTDYCVRGTELTLIQPATVPTTSGSDPVTIDGKGYVVFAKQ